MNYKELSKVIDAVNNANAKPEIQIPTKQELISHFSKLAEEVKENPNWRKIRGISNQHITIDSSMGEWETYIFIEKEKFNDGVDRYNVSLHVAPPKRYYSPKNDKGGGIWGGFSVFDKTRERLEQNWESILEKASESIINQLNDDIPRLKRYFKVKDSFSPQMNELIEGFENMPDDVDEIEIHTSSEVPQHEIDEFVNLYMSHYPKGEEEFKLSIDYLGNNTYKVKCPLAER